MPAVAPDKWNLAGGGITVFYSTTAPGLFHYVDINGANLHGSTNPRGSGA
jgi:hypothetical protein